MMTTMKKIHYLLLALFCSLFTACQDGDWDVPSFSDGAPFGNNSITEEGLITIAELKADADYKEAFENNGCVLVSKDIKIKARVTGNDLGGNIYKQFAIQDETGALIVAVNQGGLNGYLAEGQEILIDMKGLYVGGYGSTPEIGAPYNGSIGRMSKDIWDKHFKLLGNPDATAIEPTDFKTICNDIFDGKNDNVGKLVVLKGVTFTIANGETKFINGISSGSNYYSVQLDQFPNKGKGSSTYKVVVRTSSYADFASMILPYDTENKQKISCNIYGIATRFNNDWQISIRKTNDIRDAATDEPFNK